METGGRSCSARSSVACFRSRAPCRLLFLPAAISRRCSSAVSLIVADCLRVSWPQPCRDCAIVCARRADRLLSSRIFPCCCCCFLFTFLSRLFSGGGFLWTPGGIPARRNPRDPLVLTELRHPALCFFCRFLRAGQTFAVKEKRHVVKGNRGIKRAVDGDDPVGEPDVTCQFLARDCCGAKLSLLVP